MVAPVLSGRLVGYARVSTDDQDLSLQMDSLLSLGIIRDDIFTDKISGAKTDRPGLGACLAKLQAGDTLVVWRLDRLGRSMHHLVDLIEELRNRGIGFRSVSDGLIDTTSPSGELVFHIFSALAQFEAPADSRADQSWACVRSRAWSARRPSRRRPRRSQSAGCPETT